MLTVVPPPELLIPSIDGIGQRYQFVNVQPSPPSQALFLYSKRRCTAAYSSSIDTWDVFRGERSGRVSFLYLIFEMPDGEAIAFFVPPGSARRRQTGAICGVSAA